jgi:hypothetical protein
MNDENDDDIHIRIKIPPEQFGTRLDNKRINDQWTYQCNICGTINNPFRTPDGRVVCAVCRMKELGIDPVTTLDEHRKKRTQTKE